MNMKEMEQDIVTDLEELEDPISQYTYLISCAGECIPPNKEAYTEDNLIRDCQVRTWIQTDWEDGKLYVTADSESLIVKGALALLQEIYYGRTREEIAGYRCGLLERNAFAKHFTAEQRNGLEKILLLIAA